MSWVLLGAAVALVLAFLLTAKLDRAEFERRFPPLSDAEFLARCRPGTDPAVALKVREMVAEYFAIEYERVHPGMDFITDLGAD